MLSFGIETISNRSYFIDVSFERFSHRGLQTFTCTPISAMHGYCNHLPPKLIQWWWKHEFNDAAQFYAVASTHISLFRRLRYLCFINHPSCWISTLPWPVWNASCSYTGVRWNDIVWLIHPARQQAWGRIPNDVSTHGGLNQNFNLTTIRANAQECKSHYPTM